MANRLKGEASFEHEGKTFTVRLTTNVFLQTEDETGAGTPDLISTKRIGWLAHLLRFGIAESGGPLLSRGDAAELLLAVPAAGQALQNAFEAGLPPADEDVGNAPAANP
jgi:hypothetical protein